MNGDGSYGDSSSHSVKSRHGKAAARSGLPQAVATTPPSKRKEASSKLHMLSNIPVPMCHDPRPKPAPQKKQQSVDEDEEDEASDKTPLLRAPDQDAGVDSSHVADKAARPQNGVVATSSSSQSTTSTPSFATNGSTESSSVESVSSSAAAATNGFSRKQEPIGEETGLKTIPEQGSLDRADSRSQKSENQDPRGKSNAKSSAEGESEPPSPCHVTANVSGKHRLHRSAEHLGGQTKLSVFQSDSDAISSTSAAAPTEVAASVPSSPGTLNEILKVGSYPTTSSASALLDSSCSEVEKSPPIVKKKSNLPRIGILRRGSDRTAEVCRRGSERGIMAGIPLSSRRHDPSVEDLKRATSISELCQSVASLLNIGKSNLC